MTNDYDPKLESAKFTAYWQGYDRGFIDGKAGGYVMPEPKFTKPEAPTPHSDTDAHPENQGSDLFAANAGITPEQARYAYDSALGAPTQAVPCDLRPPQGKKWLPGCVGFGLVEELTPNYLVSAAIYGPTKHRYITLSGETRQEPCCK